MESKLPIETTNWYLLYTNPRAEKKVAEAYSRMGLDYYLPLQRTLKQWSDRKKWVDEPLFKSYIFIHMNLAKSFHQALSVAGASRLISFGGKPVVVDKREIHLVQRLLGSIEQIGACEAIEGNINAFEGQEVEIIAGPLMGQMGKLVQKKGANCVLIELKTMYQILSVQIPIEYVRLVNQFNHKIA